MNFEELKCFQKVYQLKSMNQAAKELYLTAQGVGRIINKLENELNTSLFYGVRKVSLRCEAQIFFMSIAKNYWSSSALLMRQSNEKMNERIN